MVGKLGLKKKKVLTHSGAGITPTYTSPKTVSRNNFL